MSRENSIVVKLGLGEGRRGWILCNCGCELVIERTEHWRLDFELIGELVIVIVIV